MGNIVTLLFNGISEGCLIFLMASSLSVVLGLMGVVNFAHGTLFLWGGYVYAWIYNWTGNWPLSILAAVTVGFGLGILFEKIFISRVYGNMSAQIMVTLGLQIVFTELCRVFWGAQQITVARPSFLSGVSNFAGITIVHYRLFLIVVGVVVTVGGQLVLTKTRVGMIIRAGVQNSEMVDSLGINIKRYFTIVFAIAAALAGLGGALYSPLNGTLNSNMGAANQLLAFIVVVIGGMGSFIGSALGSLFLGIMVAVIGWVLPDISLVAPVLMMALVLIFKPKGLFGLAVRK
ncbi:branched-chain amino acid ABC transporter permease [Ruminococcaceae bacterium OttesenSCG-928-A16]|nr:branched-chain amino acid ABC transporter permease [Ruminococcaceae bacterium OttesenSCG-928-A16]